MAYTVPNRPDTTSADLAEPDKGDFQSLGNRKSGVLSGGVVTRSASNTLSVTTVTGYLVGEYFSITGPSPISLNIPSASGLAKFILVLVRKVGSNFIVVGHTDAGAESATNAVYPALDDATELLLAVAYYPSGATDIASSGIVDKRSFILPQANPTGVTTDPGDTVIGALGEIRINTAAALTTGESNVWVKTKITGSAQWTKLAGYNALTSQDSLAIDPAEAVNFYRTNTGVVIGGTGTNEHSGNGDYTLYVDGAANVTGNLNVDSLTIRGDTLAVSSNWTEGRTIELTGNVSGTVTGVDGSGDITITTEVDEIGALLAHAEVGGPLYTQHLFPLGGSPANWQIGSIYMTYKKIVLTDSPVVMSDRALKERFSESPGLTFVEDLIPRSYVLKDDPKKVHWGFVAQDVEEACTEHGVPQAAEYEKPGDGPEGQTGYMALTYGEFTAPIVKAIQELSERLEAIENG